MASIAVLPPTLASQIAAGEVVQRPASALKELIENALDAGSTRLDIEFRGGGVKQLSVRDDGSGMSRQDAELSLQRHATSKLKKFSDLDDLCSYGFRGEALPSISSVSRFTLKTRTRSTDVGTQIFVAGGETPVVTEVGMAPGTSVQIEDLFFNVPARRKFLRSSGTESGHLLDTVEGAALGCPDVTFNVQRDGRRARQWLRCTSREERVKSILGNEQLIPLVGQRGPLKIEAYLGRPERARAGASGLRLLCNGRPVRDPALFRTAAQAYGNSLERGRYPQGVIYLDLPPQLLDINVHPQKTEVRFIDARAVTDAVYELMTSQLARVLAIKSDTMRGELAASGVGRNQAATNMHTAVAVNAPQGPLGFSLRSRRHTTLPPNATAHPPMRWAPSTKQPKSEVAKQSEPKSEVAKQSEPKSEVAKQSEPQTEQMSPSQTKDRLGVKNNAEQGGATNHAQRPASYQTTANARQLHSATSSSEIPATQPSPAAVFEDLKALDGGSQDALLRVRDFAQHRSSQVPVSGPVAYPRGENDVRWAALAYIAQVKGTYLLCEGPEGLLILDQHAVAERINFANLMASYAKDSVPSQSLLFPETLEVSPKESTLVDRHAKEIGRMGFELRVHDKTTVSLHAVPRLLQRGDPKILAQELLAELSLEGQSFSECVLQALATLACLGSICAGDPLTNEEGKALLKSLDRADFSGQCRHGRPIIAFTSWKELDRKAGRR